MLGREKMRRVSRQKPCPVCSRPDWCLVAEDGSAAICPRISEGAIKRCGDAGYLHILRNRHNGHDRHKCRVNKRRLVTNVPIGNSRSRDFRQLAMWYKQQLGTEKLDALADSLGVSAQSLERLNIGWDDKAYTFPMSNNFGKIIGIRRRFPSGSKVSIKGGKTGLFIPSDLSSDGLLLICEGPTDTAAAIDLGFDAIGRPNCNSKVSMTVELCKGRLEIIIVGDDDDVGRSGAEKLADALVLHYPCVKIIYPLDEIKDLRQWFRAGLTSEVLQKIIEKTKAIRIKISFKD